MIPSEPPIDDGFLSRQTDGDMGLQRDVLALFVSQADAVRTRLLSGASPAALAADLHRLKGAARAVGAHRVADFAETLERFAEASVADAADGPALAHRLGEEIAEACRYAAKRSA